MTTRETGAIGIKLIGAFFFVSGVIRLFAVVASIGLPAPTAEGLPTPGMIVRLNLVAVFAEVVVAAACLVGGDIVAGRIFSDRRRIQATNVSREDLLVVGIALVGVSTVAAAAPNIIEVLGKVIWFAQGSLQPQFLASMEGLWEPSVRHVLELVIGLVLVTKASAVASMVNRSPRRRDPEQAV